MIDFFPKKEILAYDYLTESKDSLFERIEVLNNIVNKKTKIIVTTIEAIMQPMISKDILYKNLLHLKVGQELELDKLKETLVSLGLLISSSLLIRTSSLLNNLSSSISV